MNISYNPLQFKLMPSSPQRLRLLGLVRGGKCGGTSVARINTVSAGGRSECLRILCCVTVNRDDLENIKIFFLINTSMSVCKSPANINI